MAGIITWLLVITIFVVVVTYRVLQNTFRLSNKDKEDKKKDEIVKARLDNLTEWLRLDTPSNKDTPSSRQIYEREVAKDEQDYWRLTGENAEGEAQERIRKNAFVMALNHARTFDDFIWVIHYILEEAGNG
jgi:hypothetical protein